MDDQLDSDLKKHISEVFENFEDTSAEEGWLRLREKYPVEKKRRRVIWLWLPAAAALLLLFTGILWFRQTEPKNKVAAISKIPAKVAVKAQGKGDLESANATVNPSNLAVNSTAATKALKKTKPTRLEIVSASIMSTGNKIKSEKKESQKLPTKEVNIAQANTMSSGNQDQYAIMNKPEKIISKDISPKAEPDNAITTVTRPKVAVKIPEQKADQKPFENIYADNTKPVQKSQNMGKRVRFSMYAATFFNYAHGSSNQFNAGGGFTSDIRLSKKFSISTGIAIAQNTLSYNVEPPSALNQPNQIATASLTFAAANNFHIAAPTFKNYNADLLGLDVPLNLKYTFNPDKGGTYIMAGLSSGTFINETYTYSYNNPAPFSANISQALQDQTTHNSFNSFYFARTLNLSFGTGYTLGKNRLIIEPFLKYPLDGLGTQQIRFGAGGINLKFSFSSKY